MTVGQTEIVEDRRILSRFPRSFEELIRFCRNPRSTGERVALIFRLGSWCSDEARFVELPTVAAFLMEVGSACAPNPPSDGEDAVLEDAVRGIARNVLAEDICEPLWQWWAARRQHEPASHEVINRMIAFYGAHKDHASFHIKGRLRVARMLAAAVLDSDARIHRTEAVRALVAIDAWDEITWNTLFGAIPLLLERIFGLPTPMRTDQLWRPVLSAHGSENLADRIRKAGLTRADLATLAVEIGRIAEQCNIALGCTTARHITERADVRVLCHLVSCADQTIADLIATGDAHSP